MPRIRAKLGPFETFGFPGHAVTGQEFVTAIAKASGRPLKVGHINWWMMRTVGSIWKMGRELTEIGYLWQVPHRIDGSKLATRYRQGAAHAAGHRRDAIAARTGRDCVRPDFVTLPR